MKTTLLLGILLCLIVCDLSGAPVGRERIRFDEGWKFHLRDSSLTEEPDPVKAGAVVTDWRWKMVGDTAAETAEVVRVDYDDGGWSRVETGQNVIHKENTSAWFRTVLPEAKGPKPRLHFESVDDAATIYLNGQRLAEHSGWEEAFDVSLDAAWRKEGRNVLVVLVQNFGGSGGVSAVYLQSGEAREAEIVTKGPAASGYDDQAWRGVQLPHDFVVEGTFDPKEDPAHGFLPRGAGWYRKTFVLPPEDKGKVLWLEFDGVYRNSVVWLNGRQLGKHASGYTSFYYDISREANCGGQNALTVWADARSNEGWWYEGGGFIDTFI